MTVKEVNDALDELARIERQNNNADSGGGGGEHHDDDDDDDDDDSPKNVKGTKKRDKKAEVLNRLRNHLTAEHMKIVVQVILKAHHLGVGEKPFLDSLHPDAKELFNHTTDLRSVCETAADLLSKQRTIEAAGATGSLHREGVEFTENPMVPGEWYVPIPRNDIAVGVGQALRVQKAKRVHDAADARTKMLNAAAGRKKRVRNAA